MNAASDIFQIQLTSTADKPIVLNPLQDDPADFVVTAHYDVRGLSLEETFDDDEVLLGEVQVQTVLLGEALNAGMDWFYVMDAASADLLDIHAEMFGGEDYQELRPAFLEVFNGPDAGCDLAYLPDDDILDFNWGPTVLHTLIKHARVGYFVVGVSGLVNPGTKQERAVARKRGEVLEQMGFKRFKRGPFYYLNCAYTLPELPLNLLLPYEQDQQVAAFAPLSEG